MRNMTVVRLGFAIFLQPFEDAAIGADLGGREPRSFGRQFFSKILINPEEFGGLDAGVKEVSHLLLKHGGSRADGSLGAVGHEELVFGRVCGGDDEPLVGGLRDQDVGIKAGGTPHDGVGPLEKLPVAREQVMVVEMLA